MPLLCPFYVLQSSIVNHALNKEVLYNKRVVVFLPIRVLWAHRFKSTVTDAHCSHFQVCFNCGNCTSIGVLNERFAWKQKLKYLRVSCCWKNRLSMKKVPPLVRRFNLRVVGGIVSKSQTSIDESKEVKCSSRATCWIEHGSDCLLCSSSEGFSRLEEVGGCRPNWKGTIRAPLHPPVFSPLHFWIGIEHHTAT